MTACISGQCDVIPSTIFEGRWDNADLVRRLLNILQVARRMVCILLELEGLTNRNDFLREKVVAETSMLLLCVRPIWNQDRRLQDEVHAIANLLIPLARHRDVLGAICLEPGLARDHGVAHIILSRLGYPNREFDHLLLDSLSIGDNIGPERLPHRVLEQEWLTRVWPLGGQTNSADANSLRSSSLGRPLDVLSTKRFDVYAFTHAVMYASDLGERRIGLPRDSAAIVADADAALAFSLDTNNFDLAAEVLLTWPMLGLPWSATAIFALRILATLEDEIGFVPGPTFNRSRWETLPPDDQLHLMLTTSYHTVYIMGFLCAASLKTDRAPLADVPPARHTQGTAAALLNLFCAAEEPACWQRACVELAHSQRDSVSPLILTALLRRASLQGDLRLIRAALELAVAYDLADIPAALQGAGLLRRSKAIRT